MCTGNRFFWQPDELASDRTVIINETVASVLARKNLHEKNPSCSTLKTYDETTIFIPVDIAEDAVT